MRRDPLAADWCHLPAGVAAESLWDTLHDGELLAIRSDLMARTLAFEVEVDHLRDALGPASDGRFLLELRDVASARVASWMIWPGPQPDLNGRSRDEQASLVGEYQSKWREVSIGWTEFEASFADGRFEIHDAKLARGEAEVGLHLGGMMDRPGWPGQSFELFARGSGLEIRLGDGTPIDLDRFRQIGDDYWESWGSSEP